MSKPVRRPTVDSSTPIAQPSAPLVAPDPPRRPPMGEGDRCEACGVVCTPQWVDTAKRYECGACPASKDLPNGVIPRDSRHVARYCGVCRQEISATADGCARCTPKTALIGVQNIATPSRVRVDSQPGPPWLRSR